MLSDFFRKPAPQFHETIRIGGCLPVVRTPAQRAPSEKNGRVSEDSPGFIAYVVETGGLEPPTSTVRL